MCRLSHLLAAGSSLLLPLALPVSGASIDSVLGSYGYYAVPFDRSPELPYALKVTVDGQNQRLLIDTGCPITTLDPRKVPGWKVADDYPPEQSKPLNAEIGTEAAIVVPEMRIARARFTNQPALPRYLEVDYSPMKEDGYLGMDFMVRQHCLIDCAGQVIFFRAAALTPQQQAAFEASLAQSRFIPIRCHGERRIILDSQLAGSPEQWVVDTGSEVTTIEESERLRLKLPLASMRTSGSYLPASNAGIAIGLKGIGVGVTHVKPVDLPGLQAGPITWPPHPILSADYDVNLLQDGARLPHLHGILGQGFLAQHGALIDVENRTIWFAPGR